MTGSRRCLCAAISLVLPAASFARGGEPPSVSDLRAAFEAQFPKSDANGTALELERLSAALGIDLAPRTPDDPDRPDVTPSPPDDGRSRPARGTENQMPFGDFLQRELGVASERIERASPALERYLEEHDGAIAGIVAVLLRGEEPRWEIDVASGLKGPTPNFLGLIRLQRLLLTRALVLARQRRTDEALETMEASWRLHGAVLSRPDVISQLIAVAVAKLQAGVLRKIDSPAFAWRERLRAGTSVAGYEAALQNEAWLYSSDISEDGRPGPIGRQWRRFVDNLEKRGLCSWTSAVLQEAWQEAARQIETFEARFLAEMAAPNRFNGLLRARRAAIDSELTALILDARSEREAQRRPRWPAKLLTLKTGVCSEARWFYRVERDGTVRLGLQGLIEESDIAGFRLPLEFTAGKPLLRRPARKGVVVNPAPPMGR